MKSIFRILALLGTAVALTGAAGVRAAEPRPNIIVILADDQGWGDLGVHGNQNVATPRIDSLAREGAIFDRFFVSPVCSPTRAEFLTGRYHPRGGVWNVTSGGERLNLSERTIADTFRAAGYATGVFGKWHNGGQFPYHPRGRGFDEFYGFCSGHWGDYFSPPLEHNGQRVRGQGFISDDLTDHALAFIRDQGRRPFFCYLAFNTPHTPLQVPDRFYDKFKDRDLPLRYTGPQPEDLATTRAVLAMCENIDWNVGRVLDALAEGELADRTIIVYFSDNGPNSWRWNGGMRGRKSSTDEGGVRSPLLMRWPSQIRPGTKIAPIAAAIDLLPTLAELAGVPLDPSRTLDGKSLAPLVRGAADDWPDRLIFSHWAGNVSVRSQRYRLDAQARLYDLANDPGQQRDLATQLPEETARLAAAVRQWKSELLPLRGQDDRPFPVGFREFPNALLPAADGREHGQIRRSTKAPNCSYFTHWTDTGDSITWDVEVATRGRYEVVVYYTCPAESVGSIIELSLGGSRLEGRVSEAHDPPLVGAEHDRAPRGMESYMKEFRPLSLGEVILEQGRGQLTLRARTIPGRQVMDTSGVVLTLRE